MAVRDIDMRKKLVYVDVTSDYYSGSDGNISHIEQKDYVRGSWAGGTFGILASGEASQGWTPAIRSVVMMGLYLAAKPVYIAQGFNGLVHGGEMFQEYSSVTSDTQSSCKCLDFLERAGRLKAAENMVKAGIHCLVVIGGDGSLRACQAFYNDWLGLLRELVVDGVITKAQNLQYHSLCLVNIIAAVEHDVLGTDYSIGFDTAMRRITETTDIVMSTTWCSTKAFIIEVLSSHLALTAGVIWNASMVFCPECLPEGDWRKLLILKVKADLADRQTAILVVVVEGMRDSHGKAITSHDVAKCLTSQLHLDARTTAMGDIQRGGNTSVMDRLNATIVGMDAVVALQHQTVEKSGPVTMCLSGTKVVSQSTARLVNLLDMYQRHIERRDMVEAIRLRSHNFQALLNVYMSMYRMHPAVVMTLPGMADRCRNIGVVFVGQIVMGLTELLAIVTKCNSSREFNTIVFKHGFEGLVDDEAIRLDWDSVSVHLFQLMCSLGVSDRSAATVGVGKIGAAIERHALSGLVIIGDFAAFRSLHDIWNLKQKHSGLLIPMCVVPVCMFNNVPGTATSLGSDIAATNTVEFLDKIKTVASGKQNMVYVVETPGRTYLPVVSALCAGADAVYTRQNPPTLNTLLQDAEHLRKKIANSHSRHGLVVRSHDASDHYSTEFMQKIFSEEGKGVFRCESCVISDLQMSSKLSNRFRTMCIVSGFKASVWITEQVTINTRQNGKVASTSPQSKTVLCLELMAVKFKSIQSLAAETDFVKQKPTFLWWENLTALLKINGGNYPDAFDNEDDAKSLSAVL